MRTCVWALKIREWFCGPVSTLQPINNGKQHIRDCLYTCKYIGDMFTTVLLIGRHTSINCNEFSATRRRVVSNHFNMEPKLFIVIIIMMSYKNIFYFRTSDLCMDSEGDRDLHLQLCQADKPSQRWTFVRR